MALQADLALVFHRLHSCRLRKFLLGNVFNIGVVDIIATGSARLDQVILNSGEAVPLTVSNSISIAVGSSATVTDLAFERLVSSKDLVLTVTNSARLTRFRFVDPK